VQQQNAANTLYSTDRKHQLTQHDCYERVHAILFCMIHDNKPTAAWTAGHPRAAVQKRLAAIMLPYGAAILRTAMPDTLLEKPPPARAQPVRVALLPIGSCHMNNVLLSAL
jgi:hypothetical protein